MGQTLSFGCPVRAAAGTAAAVPAIDTLELLTLQNDAELPYVDVTPPAYVHLSEGLMASINLLLRQGHGLPLTGPIYTVAFFRRTSSKQSPGSQAALSRITHSQSQKQEKPASGVWPQRCKAPPSKYYYTVVTNAVQELKIALSLTMNSNKTCSAGRDRTSILWGEGDEG